MRMWRSPPDHLTLADDEVHTWRAYSNTHASNASELARVLSDDELKRANRFRFEKDRQLFIMAHGALRGILGRYLDEDPSSLCFRYNKHGKPALENGKTPHPLRFNLSHSGGLVLFGFSMHREIGIDVEYKHRKSDIDGIANRFFAEEERKVFASLREDLKVQAFFNCWTRKEAFVKARGTGLTTPLDKFEVSLCPGESVELRSTAYDTTDVDNWSLGELLPGKDYIGALAVEGMGWKLKCWQWDY